MSDRAKAGSWKRAPARAELFRPLCHFCGQYSEYVGVLHRPYTDHCPSELTEFDIELSAIQDEDGNIKYSFIPERKRRLHD